MSNYIDVHVRGDYIEPTGGSTEGDKTIQAHLREACEHKIALHVGAAIDVVDTDPVEADAWAYEAGKEAWDFDLKAPEKLLPFPLLNAAFKRGFDSVEQVSPKRERPGKVAKINHPWVVVTDAGTDDQRIFNDYPTFGSAKVGLKDLDYKLGGADIMKRLADGTLTTEF